MLSMDTMSTAVSFNLHIHTCREWLRVSVQAKGCERSVEGAQRAGEAVRAAAYRLVSSQPVAYEKPSRGPFQSGRPSHGQPICCGVRDFSGKSSLVTISVVFWPTETPPDCMPAMSLRTIAAAAGRRVEAREGTSADTLKVVDFHFAAATMPRSSNGNMRAPFHARHCMHRAGRVPATSTGLLIRSLGSATTASAAHPLSCP